MWNFMISVYIYAEIMTVENICDFIGKEKMLQGHGFESSQNAAIG